MNILENKTNRNMDEVICISKRDGNKKRPYLILNKLQAKYLPVKAREALGMFQTLAEEVKLSGSGCGVVVGFAETATAIGAEVAHTLSEKYPGMEIIFLPTTRETYDISERVEFTEDHSHAVEQILYANKELLDKADYIIFAEDEVTTGNTICHCVNHLKTMTDAKYIVASLMNCMDDSEMANFESLGIKAEWLIKTDKEGFDNYTLEYDTSDKISERNRVLSETEDSEMIFLEYGRDRIKNPRLGTEIKDYYNSCVSVSEQIFQEYEERMKNCKHILCLGTEECMYPSIILADVLSRHGKEAVVQATTRVPTCVHIEGEDTLKTRNTIESLYGDRVNYIYNLDKYDFVFIVTDGKILPDKMIEVLHSYENEKISIIFI